MKTIKVGLCAGRHEMPVNTFIFNEIADPMNFEALEAEAKKSLIRLLQDNEVKGCECEQIPFCNPAHYVDISEYREDAELVIYITGFTPALTSTLKIACNWFKAVSLMHFDNKANEYKKQVFFRCNN